MFCKASKFSVYRHREFQALWRIARSQSTTSGSSEPIKPRNRFGVGSYALATVGAVLAAGLSVAKVDPTFRDRVKGSPYMEPFVDFLCFVVREDNTFLQRISDVTTDFQDRFYNLVSIGEESPKNKEVTPLAKNESIPYSAPVSAFATLVEDLSSERSPPETPWKEIRVALPHNDVKTIALIDKPKKTTTDSKNDLSGVTPQRLAHLEEDISKQAASAIENYNKAIHAIKDKARYVQDLVSGDLNRLPPNLWTIIKEKAHIRDELMTSADLSVDMAEQKMSELENLLSSGEIEAPKAVLDQVRRNMQRIKNDLETACQKAENELFNVNVTQEIWPRVELARKHWQDELTTLFPGVNLEEKNLNVSLDDVAQFVLNSYINVQYYQKELSKFEMNADKRLRDALEKASNTKDSSPLIAAAVEQELEAERRRLDLMYQKKSLDLRSACEKEVRRQMKLQTEIQADHLKDSIKLREAELDREHQRVVSEALNKENAKYQLELAAMVGRLQGIEEGLKVHAQIDKSAQQAQDLWTACQMFYRNLNSHSHNIRPLSNEIKNIQGAASNDDKLVGMVVKSIPSEATARGVYNTQVLRERFLKVEKVARNVAILPEGSNALPMYLLSWIQGGLIWKGAQPFTKAELQDEPTAHQHLNNYDLLSRARYWVDRGDLAQALRYMNLLEGASKSVASDWMKETRIYLECQQAATVLVSHASSKGLMYA